MTYREDIDDLALLANAQALTEPLLHFLKHLARGIGLYGNESKIDFISFKQGVW